MERKLLSIVQEALYATKGSVMYTLKGSFAVAALGLAALASPAKADIFVFMSDAANDTPVFQQSSAGQFDFQGSIGNFLVNDMISAVSGGNTQGLVSQGLSFTANGAGSVTLTVTENNLTSAAQVLQFASLFGSITGNGTGVTLNRSTCFDPNNGPKMASKQEPCFNALASDGSLSAAASSIAEIVGNSPFSLSEEITFSALGAEGDGGNGGAGNTTGVSDSLTAVPEPMSMALVGAGLLGLAGVSRRRESR